MNLSNGLRFLLAVSCCNSCQLVPLTLTWLYFPKRSTFLHCKSGWSLRSLWQSWSLSSSFFSEAKVDWPQMRCFLTLFLSETSLSTFYRL